MQLSSFRSLTKEGAASCDSLDMIPLLIFSVKHFFYFFKNFHLLYEGPEKSQGAPFKRRPLFCLFTIFLII